MEKKVLILTGPAEKALVALTAHHCILITYLTAHRWLHWEVQKLQAPSWFPLIDQSRGWLVGGVCGRRSHVLIIKQSVSLRAVNHSVNMFPRLLKPICAKTKRERQKMNQLTHFYCEFYCMMCKFGASARYYWF